MITRNEYLFEEIMDKDLPVRFSELGRNGWRCHHKVRESVGAMGFRHLYCFERVVLDTSRSEAKKKKEKETPVK